jgi:hypothetical protein
MLPVSATLEQPPACIEMLQRVAHFFLSLTEGVGREDVTVFAKLL